MKTGFSFRVAALLSILYLFAPALAQAHPGHAAPGDFAQGFVHPLTGFDHLLAMFAVSVWSVQIGGRAVWLLPATFVGAMSLGSFTLLAVPIPLLESALVASVLVFGLLIALAARLSLAGGIAIVAGFALFHGGAHAAASGASEHAGAHILGILTVSAVVLVVLGALLAPLAAANPRTARLRWAGAAIAVAGLMLSFQ